MKNKINTKYNDAEMFRWYSDVFSNLELSEKIFKDIKENLKTTPHPFCGWRSTPNQKYETITINKNGLRSPDIDYNDENKNYCIFLGGSVAWGFGASNNDHTPSYQIQKFFKKKSIDYDVVNLAQNSANSHDELRSFISSVDEIKPKLVISLSGINDFWQTKTDYNKLSMPLEIPVRFFEWGQSMGIPMEKNSLKKIIKILLRYLKKTNFQKKDFFEFNKYKSVPINLFEHKVEVMNSYCQYKNIKMVHVLQPNLFYKKKISKNEKQYLDFWTNLENNIFPEKNLKDFYDNLKKKYFKKNNNLENISYIDSTYFFDEYDKSIFFDLAHFSDFGNQIFAEKLVNEIVKNYEL